MNKGFAAYHQGGGAEAQTILDDWMTGAGAGVAGTGAGAG